MCCALSWHSSNWVVHQIDINDTFLNGVLFEDVYTLQPEGFVNQTILDYVCKIHKSLYELCQTPRGWYDCLRLTLCTWGFINCSTESSLFVLHRPIGVIWVLVYVDDILVTRSNASLINDFISRLDHSFSLKYLGPLSCFLGIEVVRLEKGLCLSWTGSIFDMLQCTKMEGYKTSPSLTSTTIQLS